MKELFNGQDEEDVLQIEDDEEYTDRKVKQRILRARDRIEVAHDKLYSERLVNPDANYSEQDVLFAWGNMVRAYIRDIGVFYKNDDLPGAKRVREEVPLGEVILVPRPAQGYDFTKVMYDGYEDRDLRQMWGFQRNAPLPEPKRVPLNGLQSLVNHDNTITHRWAIVKNPRAPAPNREIIETHDEQPIPKTVYEEALSVSDTFLQNINIGVKVDPGELKPDKKDPL